MIISSPYTTHNPRLTVMRWAAGVGLGVLALALFRVQIVHSAHFDSRLEAQSLRRIRIPSARGEIVDRHGVVLARNRPSYDIVMYLEQLGSDPKRQDVIGPAARCLRVLSQTLNKPITISPRDVRVHYQRRRPLPLPVWKDLPVATVAAFAERASTLPGTDLIVTPVREYPEGQLAAHVLGYVGDASAEDDDEQELERYYYYQPDKVGRQGVELASDEWLRGAPGGKTIMVSPGGTLVGELGQKPAERGHRVVLTIDAKVQRIVEEAMARAPVPAGKPLRGAVVVLDPRTGEVLAMVSVPAFDPNVFNPGTPDEVIHALWNNPGKPTLNRAYGGVYAPGSTFKPITLLAALEAGALTMDRRADCHGSLQIGRDARPFGCWKDGGHGALDGWGAMRESCDVWFYHAGLAAGPEAMDRWAAEFGLGEPTGLDVGREYAGLLPTPSWKRNEKEERWWDGDTAQLAIGQSYLLTTPVQMACVAAALANGGDVPRPFVVKRIEEQSGASVRETRPQVRRRVRASSRHFETVRQSLLGAVGEPTGTAHRAYVPGLSVAGKTGTAEFDLYENGARRRINRVWFIGFAPYERPEVALALVLEDADSGGHTAAPVAGEILARMFGKEVARVTVGGGD